MNNEQFRLIAAPFTPLDRDGRLHTAVIDDYAAHLVRKVSLGYSFAERRGKPCR